MIDNRQVRCMDEAYLASLVEKAAKQDEQAFEELFKCYYSSVYKAAFKLCRNDADAQDIAQLTFLQVRKSIHTLEKPSYFPLWINRICVNKCKNLFRDNKNNLYDDEYMKYFNQAVEERRDHISEEALHFTSDHEVLMTMIASLSKEHRDILEMIYFRQLNQEEAAVLLQIPVGTVKSRAYAARNALKAKIEDYEKKEQIRLNFHMETLGSLMAMMYLRSQCQWTKGLFIVTQHPSMWGDVVDLLSGAVGNYVIVVCVGLLSIGLIGIGKILYDQNALHRETQKNVFPQVVIDDYLIDNEVDAYYLLKGYAYDAKALHKLSRETLLDMKRVYDALKESNQNMYQRLKLEGWTVYFEQELAR